MESYKKLEQLRRDQETNKQAAATGYFDHKYKVKPPKTAAQLEALIEEYINRKGGKVVIISAAGRQLFKQHQVTDVAGRERTMTEHKYIPSTTQKGTPDLLGVYKGKPLAIEVKFSRSDRMRPEQKKFRDAWQEAGGLFYVIRTFEEVVELI